MGDMTIIYICAGVGALLGAVISGLLYSARLKKKKFIASVKDREISTTVPTNPELKGLDLKRLIGQKGVAVSDIKPFGKMRLGAEVFEVRSVGQFIDSGTPITIIKIGSNNIIFVDRKGEA